MELMTKRMFCFYRVPRISTVITLIYFLLTVGHQSFGQFKAHEDSISISLQKLDYIGQNYGDTWLGVKEVGGTLRWNSGKIQ